MGRLIRKNESPNANPWGTDDVEPPKGSEAWFEWQQRQQNSGSDGTAGSVPAVKTEVAPVKDATNTFTAGTNYQNLAAMSAGDRKLLRKYGGSYVDQNGKIVTVAAGTSRSDLRKQYLAERNFQKNFREQRRAAQRLGIAAPTLNMSDEAKQVYQSYIDSPDKRFVTYSAVPEKKEPEKVLPTDYSWSFNTQGDAGQRMSRFLTALHENGDLESFRGIDKDGDGKISFKEMMGYQNGLGQDFGTGQYDEAALNYMMGQGLISDNQVKYIMGTPAAPAAPAGPANAGGGGGGTGLTPEQRDHYLQSSQNLMNSVYGMMDASWNIPQFSLTSPSITPFRLSRPAPAAGSPAATFRIGGTPPAYGRITLGVRPSGLTSTGE